MTNSLEVISSHLVPLKFGFVLYSLRKHPGNNVRFSILVSELPISHKKTIVLTETDIDTLRRDLDYSLDTLADVNRIFASSSKVRFTKANNFGISDLIFTTKDFKKITLTESSANHIESAKQNLSCFRVWLHDAIAYINDNSRPVPITKTNYIGKDQYISLLGGVASNGGVLGWFVRTERDNDVPSVIIGSFHDQVVFCGDVDYVELDRAVLELTYKNNVKITLCKKNNIYIRRADNHVLRPVGVGAIYIGNDTHPGYGKVSIIHHNPVRVLTDLHDALIRALPILH